MSKKQFFNEAFFRSFRDNPQRAFKEFGIEFTDTDAKFFEEGRRFSDFNQFREFFMKSRFNNFFEF